MSEIKDRIRTICGNIEVLAVRLDYANPEKIKAAIQLQIKELQDEVKKIKKKDE